ncbi:hypothetical protein PMI35_02416 [Pseudomonas sp. GM78]|uniref:hypothetical protein n=1 Tax=Pseudomonas sp. GM78 TaxID=1144337 RepID=UPI000270920B|nr:hypothetical protein [Pseudomonas sp. GM78]EJN29740.1 hypothetical protein PMI35_02416 [Pseudomonas sp. GM78]
MSDQEHIVDDCRGPVIPEPTKEEIVPTVERVITECEIPEVPAPEKPAQRRANFAAPTEGEGSGHESSWRID